MRKSKGFTLIELLVVMIIIAVLLAFGIPKIKQFMGNDYETIPIEKSEKVEQPLELDEKDKNL